MDDDTSNDVEILDTTDTTDMGDLIEVPADKPLMQLFKRLIGDSKENTVLTNTQIINILQKECDIEIAYMHPLELETYLNLMKRYLKDWPQWDIFDRQVNKLKATQDNGTIEIVKKILTEKYAGLIAYLKAMIVRAGPVIEDVSRDTMESERNKEPKETEEDVYMEIQCSRRQLNELFFRRPVTNASKYGPTPNIFNVREDKPNRIMLNQLSLKAILNWWQVVLEINTTQFVYRREMAHCVKHTLVNKKLNEYSEEAKELTTDFQKKNSKAYGKSHNIADLITSINRILLAYGSNTRYRTLVETVLEQVTLDFEDLPDISTQVMFRKYMNKYPYMRYLYTEVSGGNSLDLNMFDIQLQEIISPRYAFLVNKFDVGDKSVPQFGDWIKITCGECALTFEGDTLENAVIQHFSDMHQNEPSWHCMNCKKSIPMEKLAENRWEHACGNEAAG